MILIVNLIKKCLGIGEAVLCVEGGRGVLVRLCTACDLCGGVLVKLCSVYNMYRGVLVRLYTVYNMWGILVRLCTLYMQGY